MSVNRIAGRYAKSLLDLAIEQNIVEEIKDDMIGFSKMIANKDLALLLKSPIVNVGKKKSIFKALFDGKFNKLTNAFLNLVLVKGRESALPAIAKEFEHQYKNLKGITDVTITTAVDLNEKNLLKIKTALLASSETASELNITKVVNPDIIGGFIIEIGDKLYDNSVAFKLKNLKKNFKSNEFEQII